MLKKQIYTLIGLALVTTLIVVGAWALKSGKFAGLADTGPAEIDIFTHDSNNNPVGFVDILVSSDGQNYFPASPPLKTQSNGRIIYSDPNFQNHTLYLKASKPYHSVSPEYRQLSVSSGNKYNADFTVTPINQDSTKGKLKGKVTESGTNNPLNGAFIAVAKGTQVSNTGYSNVQGDYGVANIVPDTYTIISYRNGYQRKETPNITITANQETTLDITLSKESSPTPTLSESSSPSPSIQPTETFSFVAEILDGFGSKLEGAKVEITPELNTDGGSKATSQREAIDIAKYGEANVKVDNIYYPGVSSCVFSTYNYKLKITHPDYHTYEATFGCKGNVISFDGEYLYKSEKIFLTEGIFTTFYGHISDSDGNNVASAAIIYENLLTGFTSGGISKENGDFEFKIRAFWEYDKVKVRVFHNNYFPLEIELSGGAEIHTRHEFVLFSKNKACLQGTVSDLDSVEPIKDATLTLAKNNEIFNFSATTDDSGNYRLCGLDVGKYSIFVFHPRYRDNQRAFRDIEIKEIKTYQENFELKADIEINEYDLYVSLRDNQGKILDIPDDINPDQLNVIIKSLGFGIFFKGKPNVVSESDQSHLLFPGLRCGAETKFTIDSYPFLSNNGIYRFKKEINFTYDCSNENNKYELVVELEKISLLNNDPSKPDLMGEANGVGCIKFGNAPFNYRKENSEPINIILTNKKSGQQRTTELQENGTFQFIDIDLGTYQISISDGCFYIYDILNIPNNIKIEDNGIHRVGISLLLKDECQENYTEKITVNGIDIYFIGPLSQKLINGLDWDYLTLVLSQIKSSLNNNIQNTLPSVPIYITDTGDFNAYYFHECEVFPGTKGPVIGFPYYFLINRDQSESKETLIHEFGHHVFEKSIKGQDDYRIWIQLFDAVSKSPSANCVFGTIKDSNIRMTFDLGGHPDDNEHEYFASFFVAYFQHHERLLALIRSLPEGSDCRNILEFAWQFFSEKVAKTPGESIDTASAATSVRLYKNDDKIFGPVVGGKIGNNVYAPDQIRKGLWKQSVYDQLKPAQKAQLKASLAYRRVLNYLKIDPEKYGNQIDINIVKFNSFIDKMLGTRGDRGSIEGVVKEQNGGPKIPKENIIVIIGQKMAVTDKDGKFKIENIKTGEQKVRIIDGKTSKTLNVDLETVNIQKGKTIKRYFTAD